MQGNFESKTLNETKSYSEKQNLNNERRVLWRKKQSKGRRRQKVKLTSDSNGETSKTASKTLMRQIYQKEQKIKTITRQKIEIERKFHHKVNEIEDLKKRESINVENIEKLLKENQKLKVEGLKKAASSNRPLKKQISDLESGFRKEMGNKALMLKEKERETLKLTNELKRTKMKLADAESKMKLREDEISLLEEKILGLQKNIR